MALDDLMKCLAKGMVWGFCTLMLLVAILALTVEPIPRAAADDPASEPAAPTDVGTIDPAFEQYAAWSTPIWCALLTDQPPGVRILASTVIEARDVDGTAACDNPQGSASPNDVRQSALQDGWSDPANVAAVYAVDCHRKAPTPNCDPARLQQRFVELDPTNAFAILLPLSERDVSSPDYPTFSDPEKTLLHQAAGAEHYREYTFSAIHDTYRAFVRSMPQDTPPTLTVEAPAGALSGQPEAGDLTLAMPAIELFAVLNARAVPSYAALSQGCQAAQSEGDSATVDDCLGVMHIMARSEGTDMVSMMGRGIRYSLQNPELRGARKELEDPNRWRRQIHSLVTACVQHRGMPGDFSRLPGPMPTSHLDQFLEDFQGQGERAANKNASAREYATYPEAFALDPARCDDILLLDESTQEDLVDQWLAEMTQGVDGWERVFEAAAVALDQQAVEG